MAPLVCGIGLAHALSGCVLLSDRADVAVEVPDNYRAARGKPNGASPALDWWRGFRSSELNDLVARAQSANLDIAAAVARIAQADAQARIAGAPLLPSLDLDASATRSRSSQSLSSSGAGSGPSERSIYQVGLAASYEIDFWGKNRAGQLAAQQTAVAIRFDRETVEITTIVAVVTAYFQVLAAQDRLRIANENLRSAERILNVIRERMGVGTATALDFAQQETVVAGQRAAIPPLRQQLRQNMATLAVLIGRPPSFVTIAGGSMDRLSIPRVNPGLPSTLLLQRPDIRFAEANLAAADANVYAARAAFFPSIQLTGQGGFTSIALRTLFRPESAFYSVAASLTQPIFDGYLLQGQLELQKGRQAELVELYRKAVISSFGDVEKALIAVQELAEQERLQREATAAARRAYELSEIRLREGTVDLVTLLNTQQTLFQAQDTLLVIRLARLQAVLGLYQALGGGWMPVNETPPDR